MPKTKRKVRQKRDADFFLRVFSYNPAVGRFTSLDSFAGNEQDPLSLNKYLYTNGDPVNRVDPSGRDGTLISTLSTISIALTVGSFAVPGAGAVYLSVTGKISPYNVYRQLLKPETWGAAVVGFGAGAVLAAGMQAALLKVGAEAAKKLTPGIGLLFAAAGFIESVRLTYQMVTTDLPPQEAERYVAILLASAAIGALMRTKMRQLKAEANNDAEFWKMTPEDQRLYEMGQQLLPSKVFNELGHLDPVERGSQISQSYGFIKRWVLRTQGFLEGARNQATGGDFSLSDWISTGSTPSIRFVFGTNGDSVLSTIAAILHVGFDAEQQ